VAERDAHQDVSEDDPTRQGPLARPAAAAPRVFGAPKPAAPAGPKPPAPLRTGNPVSPRAPAVAPKATTGTPSPLVVAAPIPAARPIVHTVPFGAHHETTVPSSTDDGGAAMSPVSSPSGEGAIAMEALRETVAATEQAVAGMRSWQRGMETRVDRMELAIAELLVHSRAPAAAPRAPVATVLQSPVVPHHAAAVQAFPAVQQTVAMAAVAMPTPPPSPMAAPAPAPMPPPAVVQSTLIVPVQQAAPIAMAAAGYVVPHDFSYSDDRFDVDISALNGGRRKRRIAIVALLILVLGVGGLVTLAIVSQATHGL
jgi:hypothetical protein